MMDYGLPPETLTKIRCVFTDHPNVQKVVLYGSRAKGNYKTGSDIDLTMFGSTLTHKDLLSISSALDDLLLPYLIDLSIFDHLTHEDLREHIQKVGVVVYEKRL